MMRHLCLIMLTLLSCFHDATPAERPAVGPAIPITPGEQPWVITKLRVTDCRVVRGFVGAPVDGTVRSGSWDGKTWEYPQDHTDMGVMYTHFNNNGVHITLAGDEGFNAVVVRGGIRADLRRDVRKYDDPDSGPLIHNFPGGADTSRAWFDQPVKTSRVSFFNVGDGMIGDASFYRVRRGLGNLPQPQPLAASQPRETGLAALGVEFEADADTHLTLTVADPLNARLVLHNADYLVKQSGRVRLVCDFPDQVIAEGTNLSIKVETQGQIRDVKYEQYLLPTEDARPEALEHRKFILHAIYTPVSEARPWNIWNQPGDDEKYFARPADTGDALQDRLRPWVRDIVMTLQQCRDLDPEGKDPIVRQMHQWIYRKILTKSPSGMPPFPTRFDSIEGVPEWASLVRQAWLQAREVPKWWIENRMAPNGEFGGLLADDSDMYQNYSPFPMLERNGIGGALLDAGARMAELIDAKMLKEGINKRSMDPLHAYEEGLNHEALMAYWNYGDPIYLERCMAAARSTAPLTMITSKGHRHFISDTLGWDEIAKPPSPQREHGAHCLMWHPTFIAAWYNRHPSAMQWLTQWGDGWLDHMTPGEYGHEVKLPEDVTSKADPDPFTGGWGMTGSVFTFLADLTNDARFIRPYTEYFATKGNTGVHLAEIYQMGMLPGAEQSLDSVKGPWPAVLYNLANTGPWNAALYATGDKKPLIAALKKDIEELQRFGYMYTAVECFTDRVFLYAIINPSIAYTGGYTTRNKLNLSYAVSWDGFGTDYAALVTAATRDHLKVLLCNVSDRPLTGKARLWRLEPGEYELTFGPDADNDDRADRVERSESLKVTRGDQIELTLPPKVVQVLELKQKSKSEGIFDRADLALAQRELKISDGKISGIVHNIGVKEVEEAVVALVDAQGKAIQNKRLGPLAAPMDLRPKTATFEFDSVPDATGWSVVVDPDGAVAEIFEGNNRAKIGE